MDDSTPIEPVIDTTPTGPIQDVAAEPVPPPEPYVSTEPYVLPEPDPLPEPVPPPEQYVPTEPDAPTEPYVAPEPSPYITTIDELMSTERAIIRKEIDDLVALSNLFEPVPATLKTSLITWASLGFPANWVVGTAQANPPVVCSDSQKRPFYEYILYLIKSPIQPFLDALNARVPGVTFNFFLKDVNTIGLNVSKA